MSSNDAITNDITFLKTLPCEDQLKIAEALASNLGYKLAPEDNEQSIQIKTIINRIASNGPVVVDQGDRELVKLGLERLLK